MRKLTTTSILNDDEITLLAHGIHQLLGEGVTLAAEAYGLDVEAMLRFMPVAEGCRIARARKDLSLKDAARALRVPQYRLKDIEENRVGAVDQAVLILYVELLDIKQWFSRWKAQNSSLYESLRAVARQAQ
jgi:Helix-turn-helix domain